MSTRSAKASCDQSAAPRRDLSRNLMAEAESAASPRDTASIPPRDRLRPGSAETPRDQSASPSSPSRVLLAGADVDARYAALLARELAARGVAADLARDHAPETVDYIVLDPGGPLRDFRPFTRAKAILSLWAGVEAFMGNATITQPFARMVDPGMTRAMTEYVAGHVLRHHLGMDAHIRGLRGLWRQDVPKLAPDRRVTILGMGELGQSAARALAGLGFAVTGWSRSPKALPCLARSCAGMGELDAALEGAEILVLLLPRTADTEDLIDAARLARLAPGACLINAARGPLIVDDDLLAALDSGRLGHATLDVFRTEPLPPDHPFWSHPRVTVTPHVAAATQPATAAAAVAENIARVEAGLPLNHQVDWTRGY